MSAWVEVDRHAFNNSLVRSSVEGVGVSLMWGKALSVDDHRTAVRRSAYCGNRALPYQWMPAVAHHLLGSPLLPTE